MPLINDSIVSSLSSECLDLLDLLLESSLDESLSPPSKSSNASSPLDFFSCLLCLASFFFLDDLWFSRSDLSLSSLSVPKSKPVSLLCRLAFCTSFLVPPILCTSAATLPPTTATPATPAPIFAPKGKPATFFLFFLSFLTLRGDFFLP